MLGVSVATVRGWADQKLLPSHRTVGGHRRFEVDELKQWLADRGAPVPDRVRRFTRSQQPADLPPCPALARELNARTESIAERVQAGYNDGVPTWGPRQSDPALRRTTIRFLRVAAAALETGSVDRSVGRAEVAGFRGALQGDAGTNVILEFTRIATAVVVEAEDAVAAGDVDDPWAIPSLLAVLEHIQAALLAGTRDAERQRSSGLQTT
jgi:excisionase family DNA binding protein